MIQAFEKMLEEKMKYFCLPNEKLCTFGNDFR